MTAGNPIEVDMRRPIRVWGIVFVAAALVSVEMTREVLTSTGLTQFDPTVTRWIVEHRAAWLNLVAASLTWLGSSFVIIPLGLVVGAFFWFRRRQLMPLLRLAVAFLGAAAIYDVVKPAVGRARPAAQLQVGGPDGGFAFPSGHSTQSIAFYGMLALVLWLGSRPGRRLPVTICAGLVVLIVGASRLYLGVHWLSDVLGGFAMGLAWLALTMIIMTLVGSLRLRTL